MRKNFAKWLQDAWYKEMYISGVFMPISMLYADFVRFRAFLYRVGLRRKTRLPIPVVIVGNITVGGTGKTPLVLYLARLLRQEGYQPAIISRGYEGNSTQAVLVDASSTVAEVGDEAVLMYRRADCPIAVGQNRVAAAQILLRQGNCNIILSDDGLQHYALQRDIEIAVIDGTRRFGNGYMLPCGPLREPTERLESVDLVIVNGSAYEDGEYTMAIAGQTAVNLQDGRQLHLADFTQPCIAVAGIGNPQRFFDLLVAQGVKASCHAFPDHHQFTAEDLQFAPQQTVLMTEKDAVKCTEFATSNFWYVPITAQPEAKFTEQLLTLIKNKANE